MALEHGQPLLSFADYQRLPDEPRGEVIEGVFVVTPAPSVRHQRIVLYLVQQIANWLDAHPALGEVLVAPVDVVLRAEVPAVILQPDVMFVAAEHGPLPTTWLDKAPDLIIEVVSPSGATRDGRTKRDLYAHYGARELWLVWPEDGRVDVLHAAAAGRFDAPRALRAGDALSTPLLPGLVLDVARVLDPRRRPSA